MDILEFKQKLEKRLEKDNRRFVFDEEHSSLRVDHTGLNKGVDLDLNKLLAKNDKDHEQALKEAADFINASFEAMERNVTLKGKEKNIYPVLRSTSFPTETRDGKTLIFSEHTAETRIYYALDLGEAYTMLEQETADKEGFTAEQLKELALFNVRSLENTYKTDEVAGNTFYFINTNDGYDASRLLNEAFTEEISHFIEGDMAVAVPHQDVLIIADIHNDQGYDVLGQMTFRFFNNGRIPITALPFLYENGSLEPIFILARKKPQK
ncbi:uncharacterized protein YtpQ (UPF0354 family) [Salibacterium salarium]|uniref:DUF1444 family protein n=1 Tax=Salibacterium salarium TaxID=284579 RepID=UPI00277D6B91|nr:DUF1444 family protein [Salibacterium salarium]MDQ0298530.1 uncharacterized protein YtpQ (UPF0354 family) [Salibacterium salarium]